MSQRTTTVRIDQKQRDLLKIIASLEHRKIQDIINSLVEEYIQRHREILEILAHPDWADIIRQGKEEVKQGVAGKSLDELED